MPTTKHYLRATPPPGFAHAVADSWRSRAACHEHPTLPPSTWDDSVMGEEGKGHAASQARQKRIAVAKTVCRTECPVRVECMNDVDLDFDEGVRGGEDLRRVRHRAAVERNKAGGGE